MKVVTVIGARPQFVKAALVSRALAAVQVEEFVIHTGQHFDHNMSDVFFNELGMAPPRRNLGIGGGSHGQNTGRMIEALEPAVLAERPDCVLVFGDTFSTLSTAIVAAKLLVPLAHVEAGLRSFNRQMPEEINRVLTDHCAQHLFAPTELAVANLADENIREGVHHVGDVMFDAALHFGDLAQSRSSILTRHGLTSGGYVLCTLHRKENVDAEDRLVAIIAGLSASSLPVVMPLHPRTRQRLVAFGIRLPVHVRTIDPVGYLDMLMLERNASRIVTDSGGVQKEAFFHRVPCITVRDETEWVELVDVGANILVGADRKKLSDALALTFDPANFDAKLYGSGRASEKISEILVNAFG